jgi:hypothetical protein
MASHFQLQQKMYTMMSDAFKQKAYWYGSFTKDTVLSFHRCSYFIRIQRWV